MTREERMRDSAILCLRSYSEINPNHTLTVALDEHPRGDYRIYIYDRDRVQARVWIRGYPAPSRDRFMVQVVKDYSDAVGEMLRFADERLSGELSRNYRENDLRPHVVPPLQQLLERG